MVTDTVADLLTRIRNASMAGHDQTVIPHSKFRESIVNVLKENDYVEDYHKQDDNLVVDLAYRDDGPMIMGLERVSRPGRRIYVKVDTIPWVKNGLGIAIISTSRGVLSDKQARQRNVGGELVCKVW